MRKVLVTYDPFYGSWPYKALTEMPGYPASIHNAFGWISANGPTEEFAIENLRRVVREWSDSSAEREGWTHEVEVDW